MVTSINLGGFYETNGKTVLSGSASGLDTEGLINGLAEAKRLPAVQLEGRIEDNALESEAYSGLRTILTSFMDAADLLRNPPGVGNEDENIFEYRNAGITYSGSTAASTYLSVTAEPGASISSYDVTVDELATQNIKVTNTFAVADMDTQVVGGAAPFAAGTLTLGAAGIPVVLASGDTLNEVVSKINTVKDQSGVEASVIQVSTGNYRLALKTTDTGTSQNYLLDAASLAVMNMGMAIEDDALNAQMTVDGTVISRETNNIDDVIEGLTFNLLEKTEVTEDLKVSVGADTELVKSAIFGFVDAYNEFRIFAAEQTEVDDNGEAIDSAVLSSSSTLRTVISRVNAEVANVVDGITSGDPDRLADIGINFSDYDGDEETPFVRNILVIDEAELDSALSANFEAVRNIFEFDFTTDDPDLTVFSRTNALDTTSVSLNIDQTNGVYEATYDNGSGPITIDLDAESLSGGGIVLTGQSGTVLEGLTLIYANSSDATVNVDLTQGIGDRIYNALDGVLSDDNGLLTLEMSSIEDENDRLQTEIDRIDDIVEAYREQLLNQFSALESAISQANTLLQSLAAQADARNQG